MGRRKPLRAAAAAALSLAVLACSKSSTASGATATVEYSVSPASAYFTQVTYTGASGQAVSVNDLSTFPGGKKDVSVSAKPFDAKISTVMNNTTAATITFTIAILVDGQVKAFTNGSAPPGVSAYTTSAEYMVQ